jgi:hypothetical protein
VTPNDAYVFFVELVSQLFHADVLITDQAQRIEALEADLARLRPGPGERNEPGRMSGRPRARPGRLPRRRSTERRT